MTEANCTSSAASALSTFFRAWARIAFSWAASWLRAKKSIACDTVLMSFGLVSTSLRCIRPASATLPARPYQSKASLNRPFFSSSAPTALAVRFISASCRL